MRKMEKIFLFFAVLYFATGAWLGFGAGDQTTSSYACIMAWISLAAHCIIQEIREKGQKDD